MSDPTVPTRRYWMPLLAILVAAAIVIGGISSRWSQARQLAERSAERAIPTVALVTPSNVESQVLALPGRIEAWASAPIYARVAGYLTQRTVDIGAVVKAGQTLAEIDTPELDQQLAQARAELAVVRSETELAATSAERWQSLLERNFVSRQEVAERVAGLDAKRSQVQSLVANVERARSLQQHQRLVAPFDGIVTARNTDVGSLINVGMTPGSELFVVSDVHRLRVYTTVPQRQVASIQPGGRATLTVPEHPTRQFMATVQSQAQSINAGSGGMLVQLVVDNPDGALLPGGFATVRFEGSAEAVARALPPSALIVDRHGVRIATVGDDSRVQFKAVTIARDFGNLIELTEGPAESDRVIDSPPEGLADGDAVQVALPVAAKAP